MTKILTNFNLKCITEILLLFMIQSQDKTNNHPLTNKTETLIKLN